MIHHYYFEKPATGTTAVLRRPDAAVSQPAMPVHVQSRRAMSCEGMVGSEWIMVDINGK